MDGRGYRAVRRLEQLVAQVGHRFGLFASVAILLRVPSWFQLGDNIEAVTDRVGALLTILLAVSLLHAMIPLEPCVRCFTEPTNDPEAATERAAWWLWLAHRMAAHLTFALIGLSAIAATGFVLAHMTRVGLFYLPSDLAILGMIYAAWRHTYLQPWCPYCRDNGGGFDEVPDPDPVRTERRTS